MVRSFRLVRVVRMTLRVVRVSRLCFVQSSFISENYKKKNLFFTSFKLRLYLGYINIDFSRNVIIFVMQEH